MYGSKVMGLLAAGNQVQRGRGFGDQIWEWRASDIEVRLFEC